MEKTMQEIAKAIAAFLTSLFGVIALVFNTQIGISPEVIGSISMVVATVLVWAIPNKPKDTPALPE